MVSSFFFFFFLIYALTAGKGWVLPLTSSTQIRLVNYEDTAAHGNARALINFHLIIALLRSGPRPAGHLIAFYRINKASRARLGSARLTSGILGSMMLAHVTRAALTTASPPT